LIDDRFVKTDGEDFLCQNGACKTNLHKNVFWRHFAVNIMVLTISMGMESDAAVGQRNVCCHDSSVERAMQ
jgi:hypothetical protein